jgi:hypothetical protein
VSTWNLVLEFDTDDAEFCRGVQVGAMYVGARDLESGEYLVYSVSAAATDCDFSAETLDDEWLSVTLTKR